MNISFDDLLKANLDSAFNEEEELPEENEQIQTAQSEMEVQ